jgi:hypothetical protein
VDHEHCDACGFDGSTYDDDVLLHALRALGPTWQTLIHSSGPHLRIRPDRDVWSAIEYAAHSRDITALHVFGVEQALTLDEPSFPAIDDDLVDSAAATYGDEDPDAVVEALGASATRLAQLVEDAGAAAWSRGLTIGDSRSDVRWLLEHCLHDSLHHVDDVERGLRRVREHEPVRDD